MAPIPPNTRQELDAAKRMLRSGVTPGMVDQQLQGKGLSAQASSDVIAYATATIRRRERVKGAAIGLVGLLLLIVGTVIHAIAIINGFRLGKLPTVIMMLGMLLGVYGTYEIFRSRQ